jgi:hypothetical protein
VVPKVDPGGEALVQRVEGKRQFPIQVGEELFTYRTEKALDFATSLGLIRRGVGNKNAEGSGNAGQLLAAINFPVIDIEAHGQAAGGDGLTQAIEERRERLGVIKLSVGDEAAGIVQDGI